jgi:MYXO-CTERM domain-containing protein
MAAPIVTGAVALLFARDPTLTQEQVRTLLQAGARRLEGAAPDEQQVGVGALDLEGALSVAIAEDSPINREPSTKSWLSLAASFLHPDPEWPVVGYLELRDDNGKIADGFDSTRLVLTVSGGELREALVRVAPGLWRFSLAAPAGSGGSTVTIAATFDGRPIVSRKVSVGVDRWVAEEGASARGGCSVSRASAGWPWLLATLSLLGMRQRRASNRRSKTKRA